MAKWYVDRLGGDDRLGFQANSGNEPLKDFAVLFPTCKVRDRVRGILNDEKIGTKVYFRPLHLQPAYRKYADGQQFPIAESVYGRVLCLPFFHDLTEAQVDRICDVIRGTL
jgi:dTDP-4-amino-4,6-dideoxygalactose transaminase